VAEADPIEMRAEALLRMLGARRPETAADEASAWEPRADRSHGGQHRAEDSPPRPGSQGTPPAAPPATHPAPHLPWPHHEMTSAPHGPHRGAPGELAYASPVRPLEPYRIPAPLDEAAIANRDRNAPQSGWRRAVYKATAGRVNPGESVKEREREDLLNRIRQPIRGDFRIAVLSIKGGVGKTTTTLGLGSAFATIRTDRVIAVDANPDRGTLAQRVPDPSQATVSDLLADPGIDRYSDVRYYTRMSASRLEVLGSPLDPAISEAFGEDDYRRTIDILQNFYNIILTDCGTGIMHSAMAGVLDLAHAIVLVSSPALDAARSASATLEWLTNHGYGGLVREAHVVLSASGPGAAAVRMEKLYEHFGTRCRSVHLIPFDSHLAEGGELDIELLKPTTFEAYIDVAGAIAEKFTRLRPTG
jgi:MinD-like ATPase involved in chromosome partitioning or flagellar assembly